MNNLPKEIQEQLTLRISGCIVPMMNECIKLADELNIDRRQVILFAVALMHQTAQVSDFDTFEVKKP
jgi:hypothetical protein